MNLKELSKSNFVVQVNLPNKNTKEEMEFLNSFRLER